MERLVADIKDIGQLLQSQIAAVGASRVEAAIAAQCNQIVNRIGALPAATAQHAMQMTVAIQEGPWSPDQKTSLIEAVNSKMIARSDEQAPSDATRKATQTMTTFPAYLKQSDVDLMLDSGTHVMTKLTRAAEVCWRVGLYMPAEATVRHIVSVVLACHKVDYSAAQTYNFVQEFKTHIRSKTSLKHLPNLGYHIETYPGSPKDLRKELYESAYPDAPPADFNLDCDLSKIAAGVAIRKNSRLLFQPSSSSMPSASGMPGTSNSAAAQFMQGMMMFASSLGMNQTTSPVRLLNPAPRSRLLAITDQAPSPDEALPAAPCGLTLPAMQPAETANGSGSSPPAHVGVKKDDASALFDMPNTETSARFTAQAQSSIFGGALAVRTEERRALKRPAAAVEESQVEMPKKQGEPAVHYNGGKILRSDTQKCWRVFLNASDKPDKKVKFNNNPAKAWAAAMRMIDDHVDRKSK